LATPLNDRLHAIGGSIDEVGGQVDGLAVPVDARLERDELGGPEIARRGDRVAKGCFAADELLPDAAQEMGEG
jgi:hypothetical protein